MNRDTDDRAPLVIAEDRGAPGVHRLYSDGTLRFRDNPERGDVAGVALLQRLLADAVRRLAEDIQRNHEFHKAQIRTLSESPALRAQMGRADAETQRVSIRADKRVDRVTTLEDWAQINPEATDRWREEIRRELSREIAERLRKWRDPGDYYEMEIPAHHVADWIESTYLQGSKDG